MTAVADSLIARLVEAERRQAEVDARVARLESKVSGGDLDDDAMQIGRAARFCGYSINSLRRLAKSDPALARCYHKAPGRSSRLIFSRKALEAWKAARR